MWLLSSTTASSAWRRGETARVMSILSRSRMLRSISSRVTWSPLAVSSLYRRCARTAGSAVMKSFSSASGNTTVPMSRPSITTPRRRPISCCRATSLRRTSGMALTRLTQFETSIVRIFPSARSPLTYMSLAPRSGLKRKVIEILSRSFTTASSSTIPERMAPCSRAWSVTARYMAPVSMKMYPRRAAIALAKVLLPHEENPSTAMIILCLVSDIGENIKEGG